MGFYYNGIYSTELNIESISSYENGIEIINNDEIIFNFQNFNNDSFNTNYLYKIIITYDNNKKVLSKVLKGKDNNWLIHKDKFIHKNPNDSGKIDIALYDLLGNKVSFSINYNIKKQSFQTLGIELELVSANITNKKEVSYVFRDLSKNQLFLAKMEKT